MQIFTLSKELKLFAKCNTSSGVGYFVEVDPSEHASLGAVLRSLECCDRGLESRWHGCSSVVLVVCSSLEESYLVVCVRNLNRRRPAPEWGCNATENSPRHTSGSLFFLVRRTHFGYPFVF
jgi:hypothetical protein